MRMGSSVLLCNVQVPLSHYFNCKLSPTFQKKKKSFAFPKDLTNQVIILPHAGSLGGHLGMFSSNWVIRLVSIAYCHAYYLFKKWCVDIFFQCSIVPGMELLFRSCFLVVLTVLILCAGDGPLIHKAGNGPTSWDSGGAGCKAWGNGGWAEKSNVPTRGEGQII